MITYIITVYLIDSDYLEIEAFDVDGLESLTEAIINIVNHLEKKYCSRTEIISIVRGSVKND